MFKLYLAKYYKIFAICSGRNDDAVQLGPFLFNLIHFHKSLDFVLENTICAKIDVLNELPTPQIQPNNGK